MRDLDGQPQRQDHHNIERSAITMAPTSILLSDSGSPPTRPCSSTSPDQRLVLDLVERWFALITDQAIRRGSFQSVTRLEQAITRWLAHWNRNAKPFRWTRSAADIKQLTYQCYCYL
jgi:hypothetical protein